MNAEIAETPHLALHRERAPLYRKLGARNRAEAVRLARDFGLL